MLGWRLSICRSPTMGEKLTRPFPLSSGINSSFASDCGLLVIAPKRPHVVSFKTLTVRSGSALPSLHQNSQPMSHGTYSASSFKRSNTIRAASITSLPTPSPGIHAILYLAIGVRPYRRGLHTASCGAHTRLACRIRRLASAKWLIHFPATSTNGTLEKMLEPATENHVRFQA